MPQRKSGIKELRKSKRRRMHNLDIKSDLKKTIKKYQALIRDKQIPQAKDALKLVYKKMDKAVKRNLLHKNTASRKKSGLSKSLNEKAS